MSRRRKRKGARPGPKPRFGATLSVARTIKLTPSEAALDDAARGAMPWAEWDRRARAAAREAARPTDPPTT